MGFIGRIRQLLGASPPLSAEGEYAVNAQLRAFVRERFAEKNQRNRREGISESVARDHMLEMVAMHLGDRALKEATIKWIAASAMARMPLAGSEKNEATLLQAIEGAVKARFSEKVLMSLLVDEVRALERAPAERPAVPERPPSIASAERLPVRGEIEVEGTRFPLAHDISSLCKAVDAGGRAALRIKTLTYGGVLVNLMTAMQRQYGERSEQVSAIAAANLVCEGCQVEVPGSFKLALQDPGVFGGGMLVMGGMPGRDEFARTGACPRCGGTESYYLYDCVDREQIDSSDVHAIRDYWRDLARSWWARETRASAICDWCNSDVARGDGYLSGSSLLCDDCMTKGLMTEGLAKLKQNPEYYGAGLIRKARSARPRA